MRWCVFSSERQHSQIQHPAASPVSLCALRSQSRGRYCGGSGRRFCRCFFFAADFDLAAAAALDLAALRSARDAGPALPPAALRRSASPLIRRTHTHARVHVNNLRGVRSRRKFGPSLVVPLTPRPRRSEQRSDEWYKQPHLAVEEWRRDHTTPLRRSRPIDRNPSSATCISNDGRS